MSMKANKNGKEYPIGVIPQSIIDAVINISGLKIYKLSGTTASTVNTFVYLPLPNGVDANKVFVLGHNVRNSTYGWYYSNASSVTCLADSNNGVRVGVSEESFTSQPFSVLLGVV